MLVHAAKDSLVNALQYVLKAVSTNHPVPILTGIKIQAETDGLRLTASNSSMTIRHRIPQHHQGMYVVRTGSIVVPARYFYEMIRKSEAGMVHFEIKDSLLLSITSGHSLIRLCGMDAAEYPSFTGNEIRPPLKIRMNNALLKSAIKQVAMVASTSETRPVLTGVYLNYEHNDLKLTATDGVRLASRTLPVEQRSETSASVIIPGKNLNEVSKMLDEEDYSTEIEVSDNRIQFTCNETQVQSVLIEGTYPSIANVIPRSFLAEVTVELSYLLHAIERSTVLASESAVMMEVNSGKLVLLSRTAQIGDVQDEVPIEELKGDSFRIALNGKLFLDILRCIDCTYIQVKYTGKASPIVIKPLDRSQSALFLITPLRTADCR